MNEASGEDNLKYVAPQAVGYPFANELPILFVRNRAVLFATQRKVVRGEISVVDQAFEFVQVGVFVRLMQLDQGQLVLEVVEDDQVFVEDVGHVRSVVAFVVALHDRNLLKVSDCIERRVSEESATVGIFSFDVEPSEKFVQGVDRIVLPGQFFVFDGAVGQVARADSGIDLESGQRTQGNVGEGVLSGVEIGALQEGRLRVDVPRLQKDAHRSVQVSEHLFAGGFICECFHDM